MRLPGMFAVRLVPLLTVVGTATGLGHTETQVADPISTVSLVT